MAKRGVPAGRSRPARGKRKILKARRPARDADAGRTRAIERALAAFAHDVRTPLTGIMALSELLSTSELGERERRWVATLKDAAEHLTALTTLVVDAARAELEGIVLRQEAFDLNAFAEAMGRSMSARATAKGLAAGVDIAAGLPAAVIGDPVRLRGAIENLIDNAVKFTEAGTVSLRVTAAASRGRRVRVVFAVTDAGIGMTATEIRRLFRPFVQANAEVARRFGGAGLGLVLVKRLAEAMGGTLAVESRPGGGSTFTISVVLERAPDAETAASAAPAAAPPRRVLCVEDNPYGRVILATILKELGHGVDFVGSGDAAVLAVAAGAFDVVLMDVTLPGTDGIEATRRIRALAGAAGEIPVIGVSGLSSPHEEARARAAGMNDYIAKPVSPTRLAKAIAGVA
jgi:two-component system, sensor histidine kinase